MHHALVRNWQDACQSISYVDDECLIKNKKVNYSKERRLKLISKSKNIF